MERGLFCCLGADADDAEGDDDASIALWQSLKVIADEAQYRNTMGQIQTMGQHRPAILQALHGLVKYHNYSVQACQQEMYAKKWPFHLYATQGRVAVDPSDPYKECAYGLDVFIGTMHNFETFLFTTVGCSVDENTSRLSSAGFIKE